VSVAVTDSASVCTEAKIYPGVLESESVPFVFVFVFVCGWVPFDCERSSATLMYR
jgi:hypothetical protein